LHKRASRQDSILEKQQIFRLSVIT